MLRRQVRLRREYLYRRSLEGSEREAYERKRAVKEALRKGMPLPTSFDAESVRKGLDLDDEATAELLTHADDEYANAGAMDPRVCITTSHSPSRRLKEFAKEVSLVIPHSTVVNRGSTAVNELVESCNRHGFTDIVLLQESRGNPVAMVVSHLPCVIYRMRCCLRLNVVHLLCNAVPLTCMQSINPRYRSYGPTAHFGLSNVVMRHDVKGVPPMSQVKPHLIFDGLSENKLGACVCLCMCVCVCVGV